MLTTPWCGNSIEHQPAHLNEDADSLTYRPPRCCSARRCEGLALAEAAQLCSEVQSGITEAVCFGLVPTSISTREVEIEGYCQAQPASAAPSWPHETAGCIIIWHSSVQISICQDPLQQHTSTEPSTSCAVV